MVVLYIVHCVFSAFLFIKDPSVGVIMYWIQYLSDAFGTYCNDVEVKVTFEGWCHVGKGLQDICTPFRLSRYRKFDCHHINIRESGKTELEAWLIILPFYHIRYIYQFIC